MNLTPVKTPLVVKKLFPNFTWDIATNAKVIYLTFDDGPTPEITNWTLEVLRTFCAKATFFCIGNNVEKFPELFQNIINEGHSIGNHTHNHIKGWKTSTKDYLKDIQKAQNVIKSKLFRPPYGQITPKQGAAISALGYQVIMWNVLSIDWDVFVSRKTCLNNVISKADAGSIIVFHDSLKASKNMQYALPKVLEYFSQKGFIFKAIES